MDPGERNVREMRDPDSVVNVLVTEDASKDLSWVDYVRLPFEPFIARARRLRAAVVSRRRQFLEFAIVRVQRPAECGPDRNRYCWRQYRVAVWGRRAGSNTDHFEACAEDAFTIVE